MKGPRFIGLCTGRCGSRYLAKLLNAAGIPTFHEKNDNLRKWGGPKQLGEISGHFVSQMERDPWPDAQVWHFTRHPQPFVTSLVKFGFWSLHAPSIHPFLRRTGDIYADSFLYWVDWNRRCLAIPEPRRTTFRIEDVSRDLIARLAATIGVEPKLNGLSPAWNEKQDFAVIPDFPEVEELLSLMDELGYEELPDAPRVA